MAYILNYIVANINCRVQEKLVVINQGFNDVLRHSVNRELYDQLVRYREVLLKLIIFALSN